MIWIILERTHRVSPLRSRNFFDDIVSRATGEDTQFAEGLAKHGIELAHQIAAAKLKHNEDKTVIVGSTAALAQQVASCMRRANISLNTPRDTRDVGLDAGGGAVE